MDIQHALDFEVERRVYRVAQKSKLLYCVNSKDRPKTGFTFSAVNENGTENDFSFWAWNRNETENQPSFSAENENEKRNINYLK